MIEILNILELDAINISVCNIFGSNTENKVARFSSEVSLGTCGGGSMGAAPRSSLAIAALLPGHLGALVGGHKLALLLRDLGTLLPCYRAANC